MPSKDPTSNAGITVSSSGDRVIPSSVRADGSVRKEIRVKPGYKPPEDVEVYKNRAAEAFKNRGKGGVPGANFVESPAKPQKPTFVRNHEHKQVVKDVAAANKDIEEKAQKPPVEPAAPVDPEAEKEKEARKLSKKLRQARDLQQKKAEGSSLLPEQLEKVIRINELTRQLDNLGFDGEGNKKD